MAALAIRPRKPLPLLGEWLERLRERERERESLVRYNFSFSFCRVADRFVRHFNRSFFFSRQLYFLCYVFLPNRSTYLSFKKSSEKRSRLFFSHPRQTDYYYSVPSKFLLFVWLRLSVCHIESERVLLLLLLCPTRRPRVCVSFSNIGAVFHTARPTISISDCVKCADEQLICLLPFKIVHWFWIE